MIVKMMEDVGNRPEAKTDNLQQTPSKEIPAEMQNTIIEIKYSLEATNNRIQEADE